VKRELASLRAQLAVPSVDRSMLRRKIEEREKELNSFPLKR
jgi:replicative DNA helicase